MIKIAILLTVHNRRDKTLRCMDSVYANRLPSNVSLDVFMTDDGCTDGTAEMVLTKYPQVHVVKGDGSLFWNRGMIAAWNQASKMDFDYYLWVNDDTYIYESAIEEMLNSAEETGNNAIITGATESKNNGACTYGLRRGANLLKPNGTLQDGEMMNGNFVIIPRKIYNAIGMLDPYYNHSSGDNDYGLMAIKKGFQVLLTKRFVATCERHDTVAKWCNPECNVKERLQALNSPMGQPLNEVFHFDYKHHGLFVAFFHCGTTLCRCLIPSIFRKTL